MKPQSLGIVCQHSTVKPIQLACTEDGDGGRGVDDCSKAGSQAKLLGSQLHPYRGGLPIQAQYVFDDSLKEGLSYAYRMSSNVLASLTKTPVAFENTQVVTTEAPPTIAMHLWGGVTMTHSSSWLLNLTHSAVDL